MQRKGAHLPLLIIGVLLRATNADRTVDRHEHSRVIEVTSRSNFHSKTARTSARSSATLATDAGLEEQSAVVSSSFQELRHRSHMIPGSGGRAMMKMMAGCICFLILFKLLSKVDCASKKLDCRRCRPIAKFLLHIGWDEFESKKINVTVHSVADIVNKGMMGGEKLFRVKIQFKWGIFLTSSTSDMRWEQTKGLDIPQGADECVITLSSLGKIRDTVIGEYVIETKKDMLDAKKFWGEKKKFKLEKNGAIVGVLSITFRSYDDDDGGGGGSELPIDGIDEDSSLAMAIRVAFDEMLKEGVVKKPEPPPPPALVGESAEGAEGGEGAPPAEPAEPEMLKLEGNLKIDCLGRCITGPLREVGSDGKEGGKCFIRVINCNFAELQGKDMKKEMGNQWKKAQAKGLQELPKKWYWVWYEDKKSAYHEKDWHDPDGYIPMTAISKVNRQPKRNDEFIISYAEDGEKKTLTYRRDAGKSLDTWFDGIDACFNACREQVKEEKENQGK